MKKLAALIECLLFVADQLVAIKALARTLDQPVSDVKLALVDLAQRYEGRYLCLQQAQDKVQLVTAPEATRPVENFLGLAQVSRLSRVALECLGIIIYKHPLTRSEIEDIRGVSSG